MTLTSIYQFDTSLYICNFFRFCTRGALMFLKRYLLLHCSLCTDFRSKLFDNTGCNLMPQSSDSNFFCILISNHPCQVANICIRHFHVDNLWFSKSNKIRYFHFSPFHHSAVLLYFFLVLFLFKVARRTESKIH